MATQKLYFNNNAPSGAAVTSVYGAWDQVAGTVVNKELGKTKVGAQVAATAVAEVSATNNWDVLIARFVSAPFGADATISGTCSWVINILEDNAAANLFGALSLTVVTPDGSLRGTLLSFSYASAEASPTVGSLTGANSVALTSLAVFAGDRLVAEIGGQFRNTVTTSYTAALTYGGTGATDGVIGDGGTSSDRPTSLSITAGLDTALASTYVPPASTVPAGSFIAAAGDPVAATINNDAQAGGINLGNLFGSTSAISITGIRYWKMSPSNDGSTVTVALYPNDNTTTPLATASRVQLAGDANGWVYIPFATPYALAANNEVRAAAHFPLGNYVAANSQQNRSGQAGQTPLYIPNSNPNTYKYGVVSNPNVGGANFFGVDAYAPVAAPPARTTDFFAFF